MALLKAKRTKKRIGGRTKLVHIAIEGMDGVGKTTTCKLLAERLGYKFVEKNLRFLFDENDGFFSTNLYPRRSASNLQVVVLPTPSIPSIAICTNLVCPPVLFFVLFTISKAI